MSDTFWSAVEMLGIFFFLARACLAAIRVRFP